jgi:hypothetical protein
VHSLFGPFPRSRASSLAERPAVVAGQTALIGALILVPLLYTLVPPLEDYPNHLARIFALATLRSSPALASFYEIQWSMIPNLIMDLVAPPLVPWVGIYAAGRIFIGAALLLMLTGPVLLHRVVHGVWSAWPLVGAILIYNGFVFVGLLNYLFGVGLAVWGLTAWVALAERSAILRGIVSFAVCAILYTCHLSALGLYGVAVGSFELWRLAAARRFEIRAVLARLAALVLPAFPFAYVLVKSPTWGLVTEVEWEAQGKLDALVRLVTVYSDFTDIPLLILTGLGLTLAVKQRRVRIHPAGLCALVVLTAAFVAMPRTAFGSGMADQRLAVGIFFLVLGFVSIDLRGIYNTFFALCLAAVALRVVDVSVTWSATSQSVLEMRHSLRSVAPGARLLVTEADEPAQEDDAPISAALAHAPTLAVIERQALVSRLFVVPGKQVLQANAAAGPHVDTNDADTPRIGRVVAAASAPSPDGPNYWDLWPRFYDYVIVLRTDPDDIVNPAPDRLRILHNGRAFKLYAVTRRD